MHHLCCRPLLLSLLLLLLLLLSFLQERGDAELLSSEGVVHARSEVEEQRELAAQQQALIEEGRLDRCVWLCVGAQVI